MSERHRQQTAVALANALKACLKGPLETHQRIARARRPGALIMVHMGLQQIVRHRRHQRARQDERPDHGEHHGFGHRHEQKTGDAGQEEHRHEHDADAQQRDEGRRDDLIGAVQDRLLDGFALFQMVIDVLDGHRRVVDEDADRKRQPAQRHDVECLADRRQHDDGAHDRQRYGDGDDERRTPATEKQQDHHAGQERGDDTFIGDAADGAADEQRLIADEGDLERIRQLILDVDHLLLDAGDDVQRRDSARLQHHHQH